LKKRKESNLERKLDFSEIAPSKRYKLETIKAFLDSHGIISSSKCSREARAALIGVFSLKQYYRQACTIKTFLWVNS